VFCVLQYVCLAKTKSVELDVSEKFLFPRAILYHDGSLEDFVSVSQHCLAHARPIDMAEDVRVGRPHFFKCINAVAKINIERPELFPVWIYG